MHRGHWRPLRRSPRSYSDHLQAPQHFGGEPARKQRRNRDTRLPCVHQHFQCAAPLRAKRNPRHDHVMAVRTCRGAVSGLRPHRTPNARANLVRTNATHAVKAAPTEDSPVSIIDQDLVRDRCGRHRPLVRALCDHRDHCSVLPDPENLRHHLRASCSRRPYRHGHSSRASHFA